jgi:hypothetical protein
LTEPPTNSELVSTTLRGIRRTLGTARAQKAPAMADVLTEMLRHLPSATLAGLRTARCSRWALPAPSAAPSWSLSR